MLYNTMQYLNAYVLLVYICVCNLMSKRKVLYVYILLNSMHSASNYIV